MPSGGGTGTGTEVSEPAWTVVPGAFPFSRGADTGTDSGEVFVEKYVAYCCIREQKLALLTLIEWRHRS